VNEDVIIVGAGLAGLACARTLTAAGIGVQVIEASDDVGGRVRSDHVDGFTLDRGFQILLTAYPELYRWFDLDQFDLRKFQPGATIWTGRGFCTVGDPLRSPRDLPSTVFAPIGSIPDKLRLLKLIASVRRGSVPDLLRRKESSTRARLQNFGFSTRIIERFFQPLFAGIQLDPDLEVSSRRFDVILRMLAVGESAVPADGMGALSKELASGLHERSVRCNEGVREVNEKAVILESGEELTGRAVVVATQGPSASKLLGLPDSTAAPIHNRHILLDGAQSGPMKNLAVLSDVAPSYAPPGKTLCVAAVPGLSALDPHLEVEVRKQLATWHPEARSWETIRVDVISHGQPLQLPPLDPRRSVRLGAGRYVCGDHRDTASIQGALFSGRRAAAAVLADLQSSHTS
jgi:phytoene dehydrogenase-like protein